MREDERIWAVKEVLFDYVKSPSLRHIRDPHSVIKLAREIVKKIDRGNSIWRKWDGQREILLKSAMNCWIPVEELRDFLNGMPGPALTTTDVSQRLRAFEDEDYYSYPKDELQEGCLAIYEKEKAEGTELPAIIGLLRDYVEREEERLRVEQHERYGRLREEDRLAREQRLLSGADCKWTQLAKSPHWYSRVNGRTYRLTPTNDKMWNLYRINSPLDNEKGALVGKYQRRGEVTKVIAQMAYQPEPKW
ncbi:hypothetical protein FHS21_004660 [Phyllobacterium trifolii]|uniref:Uncharacterized protein n=1 Tax=Phyllobacterium trifolii TaxID=300193 RepID=A0A839UCE8_9HYPH|nr:hypothetical protein [Phyllobacterium trifolii]MBB3148217.1 hypothetical protein [Phyllobacterium trifolii]